MYGDTTASGRVRPPAYVCNSGTHQYRITDRSLCHIINRLHDVHPITNVLELLDSATWATVEDERVEIVFEAECDCQNGVRICAGLA